MDILNRLKDGRLLGGARTSPLKPLGKRFSRRGRYAAIFAGMLFAALGVSPMAANAEQVTYGTTGTGGTISDLYTVDLTTGVTTLIGNTGFAINSIVYYDGVLYGTERLGGSLLSIDTTTGAATAIGSLGTNITSTAINSTGDAFGWTEFGDRLASIDLLTGAAAVFGAFKPSASHGLAFNASDVLLFHNFDGSVYTLDTTTGVGTLVGNTGLDRNAIDGDINSDDGLYYGLGNSRFGGSGINVVDLESASFVNNIATDRELHTITFGPVLEPDHYLCYDAKEQSGTPKFESVTVNLMDQFGTFIDVEVKKPDTFCNPVDKNGEGITDVTAHLTCYDIKQASGAPKLPKFVVETEDQFGFLNLKIGSKAAKTLCVPSEKNGVESSLRVDHFQWYKAKEESGTPKFESLLVNLTDQFGEFIDVEVKKPKHLGTPTDKNDEGILNDEAHLTCYDVKTASGSPKLKDLVVHSADQFGELDLKLGSKPETLCLPATKEVISIDGEPVEEPPGVACPCDGLANDFDPNIEWSDEGIAVTDCQNDTEFTEVSGDPIPTDFFPFLLLKLNEPFFQPPFGACQVGNDSTEIPINSQEEYDACSAQLIEFASNDGVSCPTP